MTHTPVLSDFFISFHPLLFAFHEKGPWQASWKFIKENISPCIGPKDSSTPTFHRGFPSKHKFFQVCSTTNMVHQVMHFHAHVFRRWDIRHQRGSLKPFIGFVFCQSIFHLAQSKQFCYNKCSSKVFTISKFLICLFCATHWWKMLSTQAKACIFYHQRFKSITSEDKLGSANFLKHYRIP